MGAKLLLLARLAKKNYQKPCFPPRFVDISKKKELGAFVICHLSHFRGLRRDTRLSRVLAIKRCPKCLL